MKWRTHFNAAQLRGTEETFTKPSLTVPDQTLSIPEILKRYARGLSLGASNGVEIYEGEEDFLDGVNPKTLDLSEIHEIMEAGRAAKQEVDKKQEVKKRKEMFQQLKAEFRDDEQIEDDAATINPSRENSPAASDKNEGGEK